MHRFRPRAVFPRLPPSRVKMAKLSNTWSSVQRTFTRFVAVPRFGPICPDMAARRPTFSRNCSRYSAIVSRPSLAGSHSHSNNYIAPVPGRLAARPPAGSIIGFMGTPAFQRSFRYGRWYTPRPPKRCARPAKISHSRLDMEKWDRRVPSRFTGRRQSSQRIADNRPEESSSIVTTLLDRRGPAIAKPQKPKHAASPVSLNRLDGMTTFMLLALFGGVDALELED